MGCDIHIHTEIKIEGEWRHWGTPNGIRNYRLFEKLAGVRGDIKYAISLPKGLPEDITFETTFDYNWWGGGLHSVSWLNSKEIKELYKWWEKTYIYYPESCVEDIFGYCMGSGWDCVMDNIDEIEDVRWVFWFDN